MAKTGAPTPRENDLVEAVNEVREFFDSQGWNYCVIGGLGVVHWGEPRLTQDIDLVIAVDLGDEQPVVEALLNRFRTRLPTDGQASVL